MERKGINENIIVAILMVLIVAFLLCFVGITPIKEWLSTPFVWREPDYVSVYLLDKNLERIKSELILSFAVENSSPNTINEYTFQVLADSVAIELDSDYAYDKIDPYDVKVIEQTLTKNRYTFLKTEVDEATFDYFLNCDVEDIQVSYKTVYLKSGDKTLVSNNGTVKIIVILASSLVLGLIGMWHGFPKWLRIILKVCSLPALLILIVAVIVLAAASSNGGGRARNTTNDSHFRSAQNQYKRASNQKAGFAAHGDQKGVAKAQAEMDRSMADMIGSSCNATNNSYFKSAQERYKRASNQKAGFIAHGNQREAAKAQAEMDRAMADMMKNR